MLLNAELLPSLVYDKFIKWCSGRLTDVYQNVNRMLNMNYNALGNITTKRANRATSGVDNNTDVGTYSYQSGTHRVTRAGTASYTYNANGSVLSGDGKSIAYGTLNKPISVRRGSTTQHLLTDHWGSVERIINSAGVIAQRMSFDAFGMRRSSTVSL